MRFSIIIAGHNEEDNLDLCFSSCLNQNYDKEDFEIIYVDNNSKDNSIKVAGKYPIVISQEKKLGPSEARNKGIKIAKGEILLFLDADTKLTNGYLANLEKGFDDRNIGAGGGMVLPLKKTWISSYLGVSLFERYPRYRKNKLVRTHPGCNLAIRRSVLDKIGYFREGLTIKKEINRVSEDKEICERVRKAGYKILYNSKAVIYHENMYRFKDLYRMWTKGTKGRANEVRRGAKDPFTVLLRYNIPLTYSLLLILSALIKKPLSLTLFIIGSLFIAGLCTKAFIETGLFFESFITKPFLDVLSLIIINSSVLGYRIKNELIEVTPEFNR